MTQITVPNTSPSSPTNVNLWSDVIGNDNAITTVVNGQLSNDNLSSSAAIAHSKLANGTAGQLLIANSSGTITATSASGDATVSDTGAVTVANDAITAAKLRDDASTDANRAVTTDHIRDGAITTAKIASTAVTADKLATTEAAGAGLNTTAVTRRGKVTSATERTTTTTSILAYKIPSLTLSITVPAVGFLLYGMSAEMKSSNAAGTAYLTLTQDGLTPVTPMLEFTRSGTTYTASNEGYLAAASEAVGSTTSTVNFEAYLRSSNSSYTAYAKNITIWAMAFEVA